MSQAFVPRAEWAGSGRVVLEVEVSVGVSLPPWSLISTAPSPKVYSVLLVNFFLVYRGKIEANH